MQNKTGKKIAAAALAVVIFAVGLGLGVLWGRHSRRPPMRFAGAANQARGLQTVTIQSGSSTTTLTRDFGVIGKIQGSQITITDNANKQQQIISQNDTIIMSPTGEMGLQNLKTGQRISVDGTLNPSGQLQAKTIVVR